jgi:hypothetical protein
VFPIGVDAVEVLGDDDVNYIKTYQNQTAEDIESGRARIDSVASYGSGGSEEALLPDVGFNPSSTTRLPTSPRRTNRENLPLLRGAGHQRMSSYEDIDTEDMNIFTG